MQGRRISRTVRKLAVTSLLLVTGCATGLNSIQLQDMKAYEARGMKVVEDNETAAAWWGLAPGGGSFYTGNVGYGIVNLLFWPLSICWDPVSGRNGAQSNNYAATMEHVTRLRQQELDDLDLKLQTKQIDLDTYAIQKEGILRKYRVR